MNQKVCMGMSLIAMLFINPTYADIRLQSNEANACQHIPGSWIGKGVASNWLLGDCVYTGNVKISTLDAQGNFTMDLNANKDSGSFICPGQTYQHMTGVCNSGSTVIKTEYGNLAGHFSEQSGDAKGRLSVSPGINVDLIIQFQRVN